MRRAVNPRFVMKRDLDNPQTLRVGFYQNLLQHIKVTARDFYFSQRFPVVEAVTARDIPIR